MTRQGRPGRYRPLFVLVLVVVLAGIVLGRLAEVQVVHAESLRAESKDRRSTTSVLPGPRGDVVDADGTVLATTVERWEVTAVPWIAARSEHFDRDVDAVATALRLDPAAVRGALTKDPRAEYALVAKQVDAAALERAKRLDLGWLYYRAVEKRTYPAGAVAGNLVGFVGAQQQAQAGVEYGWDRCLAGRDGESVSEVSAGGTPIPGSEAVVRAAEPGGTVALTIHRDLQYYAQQVLAARARETAARWGAVVVAEVRTGRLLAVADWPTVDPNRVGVTAAEDAGALGSRAFTAPYEPGSTMKPITAAMLLDHGLATPSSRVVAPYRLRTADGADVNDSEQHGDERLTLTGVLVESSNTGLSQLGVRLPDDQRYEALKAFGFGARTEVGFGAEAAGTLGVGAPHWDPQSRLATMFGQGMTASAVQMASAYQALANRGVRLPVRLVESCTDADGTVHRVDTAAPRRVVSAKAARGTVRMLENVATKGWLRDDVRIPGYRIATKTGTAQESDGRGGYAKGYLVSLAGIAPADDPRYVVYVVLDAPARMNTSQATAPVFQKVMSRALQSGGVTPSGKTSPDLPAGW